MTASNFRDNDLRAAFDAGVIDESTYERLTRFFATRRGGAAPLLEQAPLHFFGLLAFWGGLTAQNSGSEIGKAVYCLITLVWFF